MCVLVMEIMMMTLTMMMLMLMRTVGRTTTIIMLEFSRSSFFASV